MKKIIFSLLVILISLSISAQTYNSTCTAQSHPDPENNGEMDPDNLPPSTLSEAYYQKIDILPPPTASGYEVQWIKLRQINNLPSGLSWATNTEQLNSGTWYCCEVTGTPNGQVGLFNCEIIVDARVKVLFVWTTQTNQSGGFIMAEVLPAKYTVSGGGSLCSTPAGFPIQLSGSNNGTTYTLYRNGTTTGVTLAGNGSAISFPAQSTVGTYTVIAKANYDFDANDTNYVTPQAMIGQAVITHTIPDVNIGSDVSIHMSDTLALDAGNGFSSYLWNINNHNEQTISIIGSSLGLGQHNAIVTITNAEQCSNSDTLVITVTPDLSSETEITSFTLPNQIGNSVINSSAGTISINMPYGSSVTSLTPSISISTGASITPQSGVPQNFTSQVSYIVTAENTIATKTWTVSVNILPNDAAEITNFTISNQIGNSVINSSAGTITATMPYGTNITTLSPTITLSAGATVNPQSGVPQNFTNSVSYNVTAQNTTNTKEWTVSVSLTSKIESNDSEIEMYYNPENQTLQLNCSEENFTARLYSINGQLIEAFTLNCNTSTKINQFLPAGIYVLQLAGNNKIHTLKFVF